MVWKLFIPLNPYWLKYVDYQGRGSPFRFSEIKVHEALSFPAGGGATALFCTAGENLAAQDTYIPSLTT